MSRPEWAKNLKRWDIIEFNRFWEWNDVIFLGEIEWAKFPVIHTSVGDFKKKERQWWFYYLEFNMEWF